MIHEIIQNVYLANETDIGHLDSDDYVPVDVRHIVSAGFTPEVNLEGCRMLASVIHTLVLLGKKPVVFCDAGIERSPLVIVYYLMASKGYNINKSYEYVISKRACVQRRKNWINVR